MKRIGAKVGLIMGCSLALFILSTMYMTFSFSKRHADEIINQQTDLALAFDLAIREYVDKSIRPEMYKIVSQNEFIPEIMSTSYVARNIFELVRVQFPQYILRFSSDNPRNPLNLASKEEQQILDFFYENPEAKVWSGHIHLDGKEYVARFKARQVEEPCLRCHGDPTNAPGSLLKRYGSTAGFNRQVGQIIGMDTIAVPTQYSSSTLWAEFRTIGTIFTGAFTLLIAVSIFSFRSIVTNRLGRIAHHFSLAAKDEESSRLELIPVSGNDEISLMAKSYNRLAERLKDAYLHLENQVRIRTQELEDANRILQEEINNHKLTDAALRDSERKYRNILESIEEGYFEISQQGTFTFFNDQFCTLIGQPRQALHGAIWLSFIPSQLVERVKDVLQHAQEHPSAERITDFAFVNAEQKKTLFDLSLSAIRDEAGQAIGWRGVIRDISQLLRVQENLRKSGSFHKTVIDSLQEAVAIIDATSSTIVAVNKKFCQDFDVREEEVFGRPCHEVTHKSGQRCAPPHHPCPFTATMQHGEHASVEHAHYLEDGSTIYIEISTFPLFDESGEIEQVVHVSKDITLRKTVEIEREAARQAAEDANRAKSEFLANMSHEIRTPLNGIVGMVELAMDTVLDDHQKNIFYTINAEVNSLLGIINDILDFSKIEAGRLELEEVPFDLRELVEDVANSIAVAAYKKQLECLCYLPPAMPTLVSGDPGRLRQIIINLAGNSVKFTEQGEVFIKGEVLNEKGPIITLRFEVTDTGIGIAHDKLEDIFESFKQADGSTTRKYGGTGLGTAISKQLAELMGGEIGVASTLGEGSTFWFTVQLTILPEGVESQMAAPLLQQGKKILIADSCRNNRFILKEYLQSWGCRSDEAQDSQEVLTYLQGNAQSSEPVALIIADSKMLETDQWNLFRQIREIPTLQNTPILALASIGTVATLSQGKALLGFLTKPIRRDELLLALESLLTGDSHHKTVFPASGLSFKPSLKERLSGKEYHVLLVEDYPTNQKVATLHLEAAGLSVELATNGQEAVQAFQRKVYDLILMDVQMPVMDGYVAASSIRQLEMISDGQTTGTPHRVPIIAMTAHATPQDRQACLAAGMDDYIAKPLRRKDLMAKVEKWLFQNEAADEPGDNAGDTLEFSALRQESPLDLDRAVAEFEGDRAIVYELLQEFLVTGHSQIETIRQGLKEKVFETAAQEAHSIKGGAANMTADSLAAVAHALELAATHGDLAACEEGLTQLAQEFQRLEDFYQGLVAEQPVN